ncbi:amidohydrolase [Microlunatus sp. Gsoil 973]|uniref:amidohydrolase n=1 Tax=Microlunatus sp. Gsoil 973 TaxID=2672569 RepID=UPI001E5C14F4|nr:amidohydrolase [Microlunatus sp. Gsoil 973]
MINDLDTKINSLAAQLDQELINFRRDLHAHPELGFAEHRTTDRIMARLTAAGLTPQRLSSGTGVLCDIVGEGAEGLPLIGLRGDIDALPIPDGKDVAYRSTTPGVCHACGHDVHTTVVLGTGLVLARLRDLGLLDKPVRLIFQPAEEASPGGAPGTIEAGALDGVDEVYAFHCDPRTEVGKIALRVGPITSASDRVLVRLTGGGGHTSRPHLTADLITALAQIAVTAPLLLSRRIDPRGGTSLIWGRIRSGTAANAIPDIGELEGTVRSTQVGGWRDAQRILPDLIRQIAAPYGAGVQVTVTPGVPPTVNHAAGVRRLTEAAAAILGGDAIALTEQSLGGEDFSWMLDKVPGAMARLGVRSPDATEVVDIHQPRFSPDERAIGIGVRVFSRLCTTAAAR